MVLVTVPKYMWSQYPRTSICSSDKWNNWKSLPEMDFHGLPACLWRNWAPLYLSCTGCLNNQNLEWNHKLYCQSQAGFRQAPCASPPPPSLSTKVFFSFRDVKGEHISFQRQQKRFPFILITASIFIRLGRICLPKPYRNSSQPRSHLLLLNPCNNILLRAP